MVEVSVVMGVRNGGDTLEATMRSVLDQQDCNLEFIVVDDGSVDGTGALVDEWARRDDRVRVVHGIHRGLTAALIEGCALAQGEFIARQDCGDLSMPDRLAHQAAHLRAHPQAVMSACAVRTLGPAGENLFESAREGAALQAGLDVLDVQRIQGPPHHGAAMFRRDAYEAAGGYRAIFDVTQDLDLWLRLRERGECLGLAEVGYEAALHAGSISALKRRRQLQAAQVAIECAQRRRRGEDEAPALAQLTARPKAQREGASRIQRARFFYFVGSCLQRSDPAAARKYFRRSFAENPLMIKALFRAAWG